MSALVKNVAKGILTIIPGGRMLIPKQVTGGTNSAHYCYEVWMKHLTMLWANGMTTIPQTLAELGPGDSIGIGLAAMLSGIDNYYALDVVKYSNVESNLRIFDDLVDLFRQRAAGPKNGWPDYKKYLDSNRFPSHILTEDILAKSLSDERIASIRNAILGVDSNAPYISIKYMVPWTDKSVIDENTVDVIISHSVLEHVVDLNATYHALSSWLKPHGLMSHQIDFTSHGLSDKWNGYRGYSELLWKIIAGKHTYLINRQPYSVHIKIIKSCNFEIICELKNYRKDPGIERRQLASRWKFISDDDLSCSGAFIQAKKQSAMS